MIKIIQKIFRLFEGKVLNKDKFKVNIFEFEQIDFSLSNYAPNTILAPNSKTSSDKLYNCFINLYKNEDINSKNNNFNCNHLYQMQELLEVYKPLYIPIIALTCCLLILVRKIIIILIVIEPKSFL